MLIKTKQSKLTKVINRIKEPSTWSGLSILAAMFGLPPGTLDAMVSVGVSVGAIGAIFLPEKSTKEMFD